MATKQPKPKVYTRETFISIFNSIARHKHRYEVFQDFVILATIGLCIGFSKSKNLQQEFFSITEKYSESEYKQLDELFTNLEWLLEPKPTDILGGLYMTLELSNDRTAQFFSPPEISTLLAKISAGNLLAQLETKPFITLSEPACGAGGMILAFVEEMRNQGINPAEKLFVQCVDIDRIAAFMCYIQLSLCGVPAQVIVGNSITQEYREIYYTPMYYLNDWDFRLKTRQVLDLIRKLETPNETPESVQTDAEAKATHTKTQTDTNTQQTTKTKTHVATDGLLHQVDFFSEFDLKIDH